MEDWICKSAGRLNLVGIGSNPVSMLRKTAESAQHAIMADDASSRGRFPLALFGLAGHEPTQLHAAFLRLAGNSAFRCK